MTRQEVVLGHLLPNLLSKSHLGVSLPLSTFAFPHAISPPPIHLYLISVSISFVSFILISSLDNVRFLSFYLHHNALAFIDII